MHKKIMNIYLKAKRWQLYIVLIALIFLAQAPIFNFNLESDVSSALPFLPAFLIGIFFFGWLWAIASACVKELPPELATSPIPMQVGLIYALVYLVLAGIFFFGPDSQPPSYIAIPHLFAMAAIFYSMGFTAKQLTKVEQNQDVSFFSYSGPFFLFWFFFIGIWFIQPKVNQLLGQKNA